ncbi:hypothetical protein RCG17_16165 [Neobacillus sp. PS3-12]|nr:hypothetical protein [Neobacillus sp. PS3-12]WML55749.1 hypothetical protein RCG17_16165 [Neobacillus sp. PS3-12]
MLSYLITIFSPWKLLAVFRGFPCCNDYSYIDGRTCFRVT